MSIKYLNELIFTRQSKYCKRSLSFLLIKLLLLKKKPLGEPPGGLWWHLPTCTQAAAASNQQGASPASAPGPHSLQPPSGSESQVLDTHVNDAFAETEGEDEQRTHQETRSTGPAAPSLPLAFGKRFPAGSTPPPPPLPTPAERSPETTRPVGGSPPGRRAGRVRRWGWNRLWISRGGEAPRGLASPGGTLGGPGRVHEARARVPAAGRAELENQIRDKLNINGLPGLLNPPN